MPTDTQSPPVVVITINGKPASEYEAEQSGGPSVTKTSDADLCRRIVALGRAVQWRGKTYVGGETIYLPPAEANYRGKRREVMHPEDFDPAPTRPVAIRQDGQRVGPTIQGPQYNRR